MLVLALLTFYLERTMRVEESHPALRRHDPDYLLTNFTTTTYNADGIAETMLSARKMVHYPDDDSTELERPRIVQSRPSEPRFSVNADRGVLSGGGEEIFLYDNVVLLREASGARPQARITTEFCTCCATVRWCAPTARCASSSPTARSPAAAWSITTNRASFTCATTCACDWSRRSDARCSLASPAAGACRARGEGRPRQADADRGEQMSADDARRMTIFEATWC
jgi:LPS export ABC transporter protein LptC